MYSYEWDEETGGLLLNSSPLSFSKEPRPVYYKELDILGFDKYWNYDKNDTYPYMWAESNNYWYRGRLVAKTKGGSLYSAPELIIVDEPEPNNEPLRFVDVPRMVEKNKDLLEKLTQETIKKVFNTYVDFKDKVDVFYVAFSGGKDSIVTLDIVQRTLPHNKFKVLFGDTGMEFPDTYKVVEEIKTFCRNEDIEFLEAKSNLTPKYTWNIVGPPAQKLRWCCSVHKTAPQINLLRKITGNPKFTGMAMMGVRADESATRSKYDSISLGTKHQGQYDFYPILRWNSAELYLYIYQENLIINDTYKKGNSRAGCLVCPMEATKNTWFKEQCYSGNIDDPQTTSFYNNIIIKKTIANDMSENKVKEFMDIGVWKSRHNGSKLSNPNNIYYEEKIENGIAIYIGSASKDWKEWLKTVGAVNYINEKDIEIYCNEKIYFLEYNSSIEGTVFKIKNIENKQCDILCVLD